MKFSFLCFAALSVFFFPENLFADVILAKAEGKVRVQENQKPGWISAKVPQTVNSGDQVETGKKSQADLLFEDASKIHLGAQSTFLLEKMDPGELSLFLGIGKLDAWIRKAAGQNVIIKTPTAVAALRGTVLSVEVDKKGRTLVHLYQGAVEMTDKAGRSVLLAENQKIEVDPVKGLEGTKPQPIPAEKAAPLEPLLEKPAQEGAKEKIVIPENPPELPAKTETVIQPAPAGAAEPSASPEQTGNPKEAPAPTPPGWKQELFKENQ